MQIAIFPTPTTTPSPVLTFENITSIFLYKFEYKYRVFGGAEVGITTQNDEFVEDRTLKNESHHKILYLITYGVTQQSIKPSTALPETYSFRVIDLWDICSTL